MINIKVGDKVTLKTKDKCNKRMVHIEDMLFGEEVTVRYLDYSPDEDLYYLSIEEDLYFYISDWIENVKNTNNNVL